MPKCRKGAVLIEGPKWCGKTTSAKRVAKSILEMQNPDLQDNYVELANTKPSLLLEGEKPRLIDEWQIAPKLWNAIRYAVDEAGTAGQYILTGSATPKEDDNMHSGVGRFAFVTMKPMTLFESGDSNGKISLKAILDGDRNIDGIKTDLDYEKIAYVLCRGGWPASINLPEKEALEIAKNYIDVSSITWHKDTVSFWIKSLNPGTWKPFKNKKIWYSKDYIAVDCKEKKFAIKSSLFYDLQGGVIDSYDVNYDSILDWNRIVPDTNGDILYQAFCKY